MNADDRRARRPLRRAGRQHQRRRPARRSSSARASGSTTRPATSSRSGTWSTRTGTPIRPRLAFRALRDGGRQAELAARVRPRVRRGDRGARRPTFDDIFTRLADERRRPRDELVLAWDFTTASTQALTGWIVVDPRPGVRARHAGVHRDERRRRPGGAGFNANICAAHPGHLPGAALHDRRRAGVAPQSGERRADAERLRDRAVRRRHPARRGERRRRRRAPARADALGPRAPRQPLPARRAVAARAALQLRHRRPSTCRACRSPTSARPSSPLGAGLLASSTSSPSACTRAS